MRARFSIQISRDEMLRWYRGEARTVVVLTERGLRLQLPASVLRPFITTEGVRGRFEIVYDAGGKLKTLRRLRGAG